MMLELCLKGRGMEEGEEVGRVFQADTLAFK